MTRGADEAEYFLTDLSGHVVIPLRGRRGIIGCDGRSADVVITDARLSALHLAWRLAESEDGRIPELEVADLHSKNGTLIDGEAAPHPNADSREFRSRRVGALRHLIQFEGRPGEGRPDPLRAGAAPLVLIWNWVPPRTELFLGGAGPWLVQVEPGRAATRSALAPLRLEITDLGLAGATVAVLQGESEVMRPIVGPAARLLVALARAGASASDRRLRLPRGAVVRLLWPDAPVGDDEPTAKRLRDFLYRNINQKWRRGPLGGLLVQQTGHHWQSAEDEIQVELHVPPGGVDLRSPDLPGQSVSFEGHGTWP